MLNRLSPRTRAAVCVHLIIAALAALSASSRAAHSQELDAPSQQALDQTQHLLQSTPEREKAAQSNTQARAADHQVREIAGSKAGTDQIYGLSSDVFEKITQETGGDPVKMQEIIQKAQADPQAFYEKHFNAAEKAKLKDLAKTLPTH